MFCVIFLAGIFYCGNLFPDIIHLPNGISVKGIVIKIDGKTITIKNKTGKEMTFDRGRVKEVIIQKPSDIKRGDHFFEIGEYLKAGKVYLTAVSNLKHPYLLYSTYKRMITTLYLSHQYSKAVEVYSSQYSSNDNSKALNLWPMLLYYDFNTLGSIPIKGEIEGNLKIVLASYYISKRKMDKANAILESMPAAKASEGEKQLQKIVAGMFQLAKGDAKKAIDIIEPSLGKFSEIYRIPCYYLLGRCMEKQGKNTEALLYYLKVGLVSPEYSELGPACLFRAGEIFMKEKDMASAQWAFQTIVNKYYGCVFSKESQDRLKDF